MKWIDEYRSPALAKKLVASIHRRASTSWKIMEVCGGQTHTIKKYALDQQLSGAVELMHGPGCPVCVTPVSILDKAISLAKLSNVIFCSFGDMLRVPGSESDLLKVKAQGADIRMVYSPLDSVKIAQTHPEKQVVFFAVGFETTAPANALAVQQAKSLGLNNFSMLVSHVLVPPALTTLLQQQPRPIDAFLAAGHVCTVMGEEEYQPLVAQYSVPIVMTGFEPVDILQGILMAVQQLESGQSKLENQYARSVSRQGNLAAKQLVADVFEVTHRHWRGMGELANSGLALRDAYKKFNAEIKFYDYLTASALEPVSSACLSGQILQGILKPNQCPEFGQGCTPEKPLGATMVSAEGACQNYYRYRAFPVAESAEDYPHA